MSATDRAGLGLVDACWRAANHLSARWPVIVLRNPEGWTGPSEVDGVPVEGAWRSHQVPLSGVRDNREHLRLPPGIRPSGVEVTKHGTTTSEPTRVLGRMLRDATTSSSASTARTCPRSGNGPGRTDGPELMGANR